VRMLPLKPVARTESHHAQAPEGVAARDSPEPRAVQSPVFAQTWPKQVWLQTTTKPERKMPLSGESPHFGLMSYWLCEHARIERSSHKPRTQNAGVGVNAPVVPNTRNLRREYLN
jgi:hypothetical protein